MRTELDFVSTGFIGEVVRKYTWLLMSHHLMNGCHLSHLKLVPPPTPSKIFFNSHDIEKLKCRVMVHNCRWYASVLTFCVELVCQE